MTKPAIKICGITNLVDATLAAEAGAAYLGLNFFKDSPRYLSLSEMEKLAGEIKLSLPAIQLVGVFVNETAEQINKIAELAQLDILQLHGDESAEFCTQFDLPVWKAFRVKDSGSLADLADYLKLDGIVLDAYKRGAYGGTGKTADWETIREIRDELPNFILSGGLTADNIGRAIGELNPNIIDICSGVEVADNPRQKDAGKISALFEAVAQSE